MSIQDFIKSLDEDDTTQFSVEPEESISNESNNDSKEESSENASKSIKIIPPEIQEDKKLKLNIKKAPIGSEEISVLKEDRLFEATHTDFEKKEIWMQYYHEALKSKKQNSVAQRMKEGKFTITAENKVLILPDYNIQEKSVNDILKDKWI